MHTENEKARELWRLKKEEYHILTDSDVEDLYDIPPIKEEPYRPQRIRSISTFGGTVFRAGTVTPFPRIWPHWCKHCCHPFETAPIGIPIRFDERRNKYYCIEPCCSDSCALGRIVDKGWIGGKIAADFFTMIRKVYKQGWDYHPKAAPPQSRLNQFGGDLSVNEFRTYHNRFVCWEVPNNILLEHQQLAEVDRREQTVQQQRRERKIQQAQAVRVTDHKPKRRSSYQRKRPLPKAVSVVPKKTHTLLSFLTANK